MKEFGFLILSICMFTLGMHAQVGIGTTNPLAVLDIRASNQTNPASDDGILIPKIDEFPVIDPAVSQDGLFIFATGNGSVSKGFYYWDSSSSMWTALATGTGTDIDWYEEGTTTPPDNINDDIYHLGNLAIGKNTANYKLDIVENISAQGMRVELSGSNPGSKTGGGILVSNSNNGNHTALALSVTGNGSGLHNGIFNLLSGSGDGNQTGVFSRFDNAGGGNHFGNYNLFNGEGNGAHFGSSSIFSGSGSGIKIGVKNEFSNNDGYTYGLYNVFNGTLDKIRYGTYNAFTGSSDNSEYGTYHMMTSAGNGNRIGNSTSINGGGSGSKIGYQAYINPAIGGTHYGILSDVMKADGYAGYFIGRVSIGPDTPERYILPTSRGLNNQIIQTDGSGNTSWVTPDHFWSRTGTVLNLLNPGDDIVFQSDQTSITFKQSTAANPSPMIYMFDGGTSNSNRMVVSHSTAYTNFGIEYRDSTDSFVFRSSSSDLVEIDLFGGFPLRVYGVARADSFQSNTTTYPDYVFENYWNGFSEINPDYKFKTLSEIEKYIRANGHLPGVKSYQEIEENDMTINLAETSVTNLEKIEELFLYAIEANKKIEQLDAENALLRKHLKQQQEEIDTIKELISKE
ncbi:hypothetical protein ALE3EI_2447 [Constantimarinum furrinae]|uniref:Peptidase S74 domain-containing protein n=2 Tax=Constantimarinum furrinae TaxID=2562285 RepID=A0A7G8PXB7_9FLAO|nr:hypothetical protein ALE3EI_2447 [Constantimarinum furrinae]